MLPPKYPRSPSSVINYQQPNRSSSRQNNNQIPLPNHRLRNTSPKEKNPYQTISSVDTKSKVSKYQNLRTTQQKRKALGKRRYINQLAYLDYEDKYIQVHTKYTMASKISAMKKIKAKNQMAQFIEQEQEQQLGFEQLMDYKYGRQTNNQNFFFEKEELIKQFQFCQRCDLIHNDHPEVHTKICSEKVQENEQYHTKNPQYGYLSLNRILQSLKRASGQQYDSLKQLVQNLIEIQKSNGLKPNANKQKLIKNKQNLQKCFRYLNELQQVNESDKIIKSIVQKILSKLYKIKSGKSV